MSYDGCATRPGSRTVDRSRRWVRMSGSQPGRTAEERTAVAGRGGRGHWRASSGIGRAAALEFTERGAHVVVAARRQEPLRELADECGRRRGRTAVPYVVDRGAGSGPLAPRAAVEQFGRIEVWVNNAAVTVFARMEDAPLQEVRRVIDVNLFDYLHGARPSCRISANSATACWSTPRRRWRRSPSPPSAPTSCPSTQSGARHGPAPGACATGSHGASGYVRSCPRRLTRRCSRTARTTPDEPPSRCRPFTWRSGSRRRSCGEHVGRAGRSTPPASLPGPTGGAHLRKLLEPAPEWTSVDGDWNGERRTQLRRLVTAGAALAAGVALARARSD